jgi:hypothetical protein
MQRGPSLFPKDLFLERPNRAHPAAKAQLHYGIEIYEIAKHHHWVHSRASADWHDVVGSPENCQPLYDAMRKVITTPTHIYTTMNTAPK